jgi:hypothetical protein
MKRVVLFLVILLPVVLAAQQGNPSLTKTQFATAAAAQGNVSTADESGLMRTDSSADVLSDVDANAGPQANAKPSQSPPPRGTTNPKIPGSMVGYIDDAIVGSQIRIRVDAAFHNNAPDRAEFFYPQCSCINGPGPNPVVANLNFQQLYLHGEYGPTKRFSFFTEVPLRWIQPQLEIVPSDSTRLPNEAGLSDVAAGFKLAAVASSNQYLTFQLRAYFPSGKASTGLGTNHYSVEPALLFYQKLSDRLALEAQVGDWHPIGGSSCPQPCNNTPTTPASQNFAGDVFFYGVGPSYVLYRRETVRIAPVIELVGWRVLGGFVTDSATATSGANGTASSGGFQGAVSADGTNIVNLKIGARTSIGRRDSFYVGFGQAVTHSVWYEHIIRAEYRYSF